MENPKIRFKGFTKDWEQRKLSELLEKYEDPVETPHDGYERVGIRSHAKGTFHSFVEPGKELDTAKMYRVAADKFILNITFAWEHAVAITDNNDAGKLVSHRFPQFSFNPKLKPHFFKYLMLDKKFREHLELSSPGGAGRNRVLKISDMLKYEIKLPSIEEQIKIGEYFDSLDNLITLHQRKCEQTKKLKKYMLQKMFPQNGAKVPEIRFDGFTYDWEQRKFGDVVQVRRGLTYKPSDVQETGVRVLRSSNINEDTFVCGNDDVFVNPKTVNIDTVKQNDILITSANGSSRLVGKHALIKGIPDESAVHGGFMLLGITKNYDFINASMNSSWYIRFINIYVTGGNGAIGNLSKSDLDEQLILVPSDLEQKKIGEYFTNLDHLITLHQRKCDELKKMKKYMLQNMFI